MNDVADHPPGLTWPMRAGLATLAVAGLTVLSLAGSLEPDPRGHGTHRQLQLPPCGFLQMLGRPCPSCGMTTSWAHLMRGQWLSSVRVQPAGAWLGVWTVAGSLWLLGSAIRGRWQVVRPDPRFFLVWGVTTIAMILTVWGVRFVL